MTIFNFFKRGYKDEKILYQATGAVNEHPMLKNNKNFSIDCHQGVIKLSGQVKSEQIKHRIEKAIRDRIEQSNINYDRIDNQLEIAGSRVESE